MDGSGSCCGSLLVTAVTRTTDLELDQSRTAPDASDPLGSLALLDGVSSELEVLNRIHGGAPCVVVVW